MRAINWGRDGTAQSGNRRRFLAGLGAAGLGASVAVFGTPGTARAQANCVCCNLIYCPPNTSMADCRSVNNYTWSCRICDAGCVTCLCCEKMPSGSITASAYECRPT